MELKDVLENRCSVRHFSSKKVSKEDIDKILDVAIKAPSAKNKQPITIYIIESDESIKKIDEFTKCRYDAPLVALFCYNSNQMWINEEDNSINSGIEDVSICATYFMLEAFNLGIDTCWVNLFNNRELEKGFNLPSNQKSVLLMPFGYRLEGVKPSKLHYQKKNKEDIVKKF